MSAAINRLLEHRWAIVAAALVTCAFILVGGLPPLLGIIGFAIICAAMTVPRQQTLTAGLAASQRYCGAQAQNAWPQS